MNAVQVDWLTLLLSFVVVISLSLAFYAAFAARRKSARDGGGLRVPTWGRVAQAIGVIAAICVGVIQLMWGG